MHIRGIVKTMYFLTLKYDMNSGMPTAIIIYHKQGLFRMSHTAGIYYLYLWLLCNEQNVIDCTNLLYLYSIFYERLKFIIKRCRITVGSQKYTNIVYPILAQRYAYQYSLIFYCVLYCLFSTTLWQMKKVPILKWYYITARSLKNKIMLQYDLRTILATFEIVFEFWWPSFWYNWRKKPVYAKFAMNSIF